jgi:hypothetical protein
MVKAKRFISGRHEAIKWCLVCKRARIVVTEAFFDSVDG